MQTRYFDRFLLATLAATEMEALDELDATRCLAPQERLRDESMHSPRARRQFRVGRVAFKTAFFAVREGRAAETIALEEALRRDEYGALEVVTRDERNRGISPRLAEDVRRGSISHVPTAAVAAFPLNVADALGCDVVEFGAVKRNMLDLFFTDSERARLTDPDVWATEEQDVVWAVKEAAYKAVSRELPFKPNQIEVVAISPGNYRARVEGTEVSAFVVDRDQQFATVVALR